MRELPVDKQSLAHICQILGGATRMLDAQSREHGDREATMLITRIDTCLHLGMRDPSEDDLRSLVLCFFSMCILIIRL